MTISKDLLLSILSMDAYNRGYYGGISGLGVANEQTAVAFSGVQIIANAETSLPNGEAEAAVF